MFKRFNQKTKLSVKIEFDGKVVEAVEGDTVAGAIMAAGISDLREAPVSGAPRGPSEPNQRKASNHRSKNSSDFPRGRIVPY